MKTLIVYDSRHGFSEKCARLLATEIPGGADFWPVRTRPGKPDWGAYDAVVVGGPVYFGRWSSRVTTFLTRHQRELTSTRITLAAFVVSLSPRAAALQYFAQGSLPAFQGRWGQVACFGGGVVWKDLKWWEKFLLKQGRGIETDVSNLSFAEIQSLGAWLSAIPSAR